MSILITGCTKGIGLAIAKAFARDAGDVFLTYHSNDAAAQNAAAQVVAEGGRPTWSKPTSELPRAAPP